MTGDPGIDLDRVVLAATSPVGRLWHVGTGDPTHKGGSSYEGDGLSVSRHPADWARIARLGGRVHEVVAGGGGPTVMVYAHEVDAVAAMEAARALGWVRPVTVWVATVEDEDGEPTTFDLATEEEAVEEVADALDLDPDHPADAREIASRVSREAAWAPEPVVLPSRTDANGMSALDHVLLHALAVRPSLSHVDGVWWEDRYDPVGLSAPRGTVHVERLDRFVLRPDPGPGPEMGFDEWIEGVAVPTPPTPAAPAP